MAKIAAAVLLVVTGVLWSQIVFAQKDPSGMIAPGLWEIVSQVDGPMNEHGTLTQEECWKAHDGKYSAFFPQGRGFTATDNSVVNSGNHTTVHIHSFQRIPQGTVTQDIKMVFSDDRSVMHRATMTGSGSLIFSATPMLDEHFTQRGRWILADCSRLLPEPSKLQITRPAEVPALQRLQALSRQLQREYPHPNGP